MATGARYRYGLGPLVAELLDLGAGQWPGLRQALSHPRLRDWFYHRARAATGEDFRALATPAQKLAIIGDAIAPGKSRPAIASAFEQALLSA